jgi:hypothetical protein
MSAWLDTHFVYPDWRIAVIENKLSSAHSKCISPILFERRGVPCLKVTLCSLSPSWEAASCAAVQELPNISWNMKILRQTNPVHTVPILYLLRSILILSAQIRNCHPSGFYPSGFPINILYAFLFSICATCPAHPTLRGLIVLIILGEEDKLWSSSLCSFLQLPLT